MFETLHHSFRGAAAATVRQTQPLVRSGRSSCFLPLAVALVALLFGQGDALARVMAPSETAGSPAVAAAEGQPARYAQRRRRSSRQGKKGRRKKRTSSKMKRPPKTAEKSAFPRREGASAQADPPPSGALRRGARVEFDGRLVQGQTAKSGAIYLFARKRSELRSMVAQREGYRQEILRTIYPRDEYKAYVAQ